MAIRQYVKFTVGGEEFGIEISKVREINKLQEMFKVPNTPPFIEGLINLRGSVLTIFNLRKRLGMQDKEFDENSKIITIFSNNILVGFTVDMVNEIVRVDDADIEDTPSVVVGFDKKFLSNVAKIGDKLMLILDLTKVLSPEEETEIKDFISENKDAVL